MSCCRAPSCALTTSRNTWDSDRFGALASPALADYIRRKYRSRHIDLVIAITNDSLRFVLDHRGELFPDAPIVFAGITVPDESVRSAGQGLAAVKVGSAYAETVKLALELHPSTERVFIVAASPNKQDVDSVRTQLDGFSRQVQLTYVDEETLSRALEVIRAVPPRSIVLHIWHRGIEQNDRPDPLEVARRVAYAATVQFTEPLISTSVRASWAVSCAERARRELVSGRCRSRFFMGLERRTFRSKTHSSSRFSIGAN